MSDLFYSFSCEGSGRPYCENPAEKPRGTFDNSCVVLDGTKVLFAAFGERFTKIKNDRAEPVLALQAFKDYFDFSDYYEPIIPGEQVSPRDLYIKSPDGTKRVIIRDLTQTDIARDSFRNYMYSSFYLSGFKETAFLLNGGEGPDYGSCIGLGYIEENSDGVLLDEFTAKASPCKILGEAAAQVFKKPGCEAMFSGLATYGKDTGEKFFYWDEDNKRIVASENDCREVFQKYLKENYGDFTDPFEVRDFVTTVQINFEEVILGVVAYLKELLDKNGIHTDNLCMGAGGILNYKTDLRIVEQGLFKHYFAPPTVVAGCAESIGRAFRSMHARGIKLESRRIESPFNGVRYPIHELIYRHELLSDYKNDLIPFLQSGGLLGWYQGEAEYSILTNGHRTFLADPVKMAEDNLVNKLKRRPDWQPVASIVPEELFPVITTNKNFDEIASVLPARYKEEWVPKMKTSCEADGTFGAVCCRKETNPVLHDFLMYYYENTGVPCLCISSLNIHDFPIVETPRDYCNLIEELELTRDRIKVRYMFVDGDDVHEVFPDDVVRRDVTRP